jgi:hypothetical protein
MYVRVPLLSIALFLSAVSLNLMHLCTLTHTTSTKMQDSCFKLTIKFKLTIARATPSNDPCNGVIPIQIIKSKRDVKKQVHL